MGYLGGGEIYLQANTDIYPETIEWTTSGSGYFTDPYSLTTSYVYDAGDVNNALIEITANVGNFGCYTSDAMQVSFHAAPDLVFPNPNPYACAGQSVYAEVYLYGYASSGTWTTSGTGTFEDPNATYTLYTPGPGETGYVQLTFITNDPEGPCGATSGYIEPYFEECGAVGTASFMSVVPYPNPAHETLTLKTTETIDPSATFITDGMGNRILFNWQGDVINIASLRPGIYLLHVTNTKGMVYTTRFSKI